MADNEEYSAGPDERSPCPICGRMFNPRPLQIHKKSCAKLTNKPRKVFDSTKQRAAGTEISYKQMKTAQKKVVAPPKSNWRAQHEDFVNTVRAARGVTEAMKSGKPLPPPPPASINPDYIQCPYCERRFNSKAAERHIGFCKEQHARKGNKPNAIAKKPPSSRMQPPKAGMAKPSPTGPPGGNRAPASRIPGTTPARTPGSTGTPGRTPGTTGTPGRTPTTSAGRGTAARGRGAPTATDYYDTDHYSNGNNSSGYGRSLRTGHSPLLTEENDKARLKKLSYNRTSPSLNQRDGANYSDSRSGSHYSTKRDSDIGYHSNSSENDFHTTPTGTRSNMAALTTKSGMYGQRNGIPTSKYNAADYTNSSQTSRFCHDCGTKYPVVTAKFCCECGIRRIALT